MGRGKCCGTCLEHSSHHDHLCGLYSLPGPDCILNRKCSPTLTRLSGMLEKILAAHCHLRSEGTLAHDLRVFPSMYEVEALPQVMQESRWIEDLLWE